MPSAWAAVMVWNQSSVVTSVSTRSVWATGTALPPFAPTPSAITRTERIRRPTTWVRKGQPATSTLGGVGVPSSVWSCAAVSRSTRSAA